MNERIRQLAEQAGFQYIKDEGIGWAGNHNASLPKFAELIVRECAGLCDINDKEQGDILREHFGVEE
jgi:hypothetical protein